MASFGGVRVPGYWDIQTLSDGLLWASLSWDWLHIDRLPKTKEEFVIAALANPESGKIVGGHVTYMVSPAFDHWHRIDVAFIDGPKDFRDWVAKTDPYEMAKTIWAARGVYTSTHQGRRLF